MVFEERLVFFPDRQLIADPGHLGLVYDDVELHTEDDVTLHAWYVPAVEARAVVCFFHGNAGNISHRLETLALFHELGVDVLLLDYRGYGRSGGRPTEAGTYRDAAAAFGYLVAERDFAPERIILFGRSLGGAVAAELATHHPLGGLILESTFTTVPELGATAYPWLPVRRLSRLRYDSLQRVRTITCPKLFLHGADDEVVPFWMGRALHDAALPPKTFVELRGGHNVADQERGEPYRDALAAFIARVVGP